MVRASVTCSLLVLLGVCQSTNIFCQESSQDSTAAAGAAASDNDPQRSTPPETAADDLPERTSVGDQPAPDAPSLTEVTSTEQAAEASDETPVDAAARAARIQDLLSLVRDNTIYTNKLDNPAYFALVKEVISQTPEQLRSQARENPRFNDFYRNPSEHRGEIVHLSINLRRVLPLDIKSKNEAGVTRLYELWGWTEEAKAWMYCCIVPELPPGVTEGDVDIRVELTGYFFKMQAYQPGGAAPNARNLVAPLVIGRIAVAPQVAEPASQGLGNWPLILIVGFGIVIVFRMMMHMRLFGRPAPTHRNYRRRSLEPLDTDSIADALAASDKGLRIRNANEV